MSQTQYFHCKHLLYCSLFHSSGAACVFYIRAHVRRHFEILEFLWLPVIMNVVHLHSHRRRFISTAVKSRAIKQDLLIRDIPGVNVPGSLRGNYLSERRKCTFPSVTSGRFSCRGVYSLCCKSIIDKTKKKNQQQNSS